MPTFSIPALVWHVRQKILAISWAGLLALALFVSCAAVLIFLLRPQQQQISQLQHMLAQQATGTKKTNLPEQEPAQQLAAFYRFFPQQDSVPDKMARRIRLQRKMVCYWSKANTIWCMRRIVSSVITRWSFRSKASIQKFASLSH